MKKYIVKQEDATDCGACALLSIIKYYKGYVPLEIIKIDTFTKSSGTNFYYLKKAGEKYGFNVCGKKIDDYNKILLPCIAQLNINGFNHFVVIYKMDKVITYMDPAVGKVTSNFMDFQEKFTGYVLEFIPISKIIKYQTNNLFEKTLKKIYKDNIQSIAMLLILSFIIIILSLLSSFNLILLKNKLLYLVVLLLISKIFMNYFKSRIVSHLNKKINIYLLKSYIEQIFNLPLKYLQLKKSGDLVNRVNDLNNIKELFSKNIIEIFINVLFLIFGVLLLSILNLKLTLLLLVIIFIYTLVLSLLHKALYYEIRTTIEEESIFMDKILEYLNKIITIKILNSSYFKTKINNSIKSVTNRKFKFDYKLNIIETVALSLEEIMLLMILVINIKMTSDYSLIVVYITIYNYFISSVKFFINTIPVYLYFKEIVGRIKSVYDIKPIINKNKINNQEGIIIKNLSYSFNNLNKVIDNLSLKIDLGEKVIVRGDNGSGKSTLLDIIYGIYDDYEGEVILNNNKIYYLEQNSELFADTILNNIILDKLYNEEKFKKVENLVFLKDVIKNKPAGYQTNISTIENISGGEKQRILLARAMYSEFDILLLDESFNEINKKLREKILNNIFVILKDKTIIYVSHNEETINFNKKIFLAARKDNYVNE